MRISKLYLVVCAVLLSASLPTVRADDNPNQAAARAALAQQMQTMDAQQPAQNTPSSASNAPVESAPAVAPAASSTPPPVVVAPAGATAAAAAAAPASAAAATAKPAAVHPGNSLFDPVPPPSGGVPPSAITAQTTTPPAAAQTPANQNQPMASAEKNQSVNNQGKALEMKPIVAPPLPISADQQAQLKALLEKYDAGTITPVEYQVERKKILKLPQ
jgi:hypothetical protein